MTPRINRSLILTAALTLLLAAITALDLTPWVRGGFGWRWPYNPATERALPLVAGVGIYVAGAAWLFTTHRRSRWVLAWAMLATALLPLLVLHLRFDDPLFELYARTAATLTTGFHRAGADIGLSGAEWRDWSAFVHQPQWEGGHVAVAPPGLPLVYSALAAFFDSMPALANALRAPLIAYQCQNYNFLGDTAGEWAAAWLGILMPAWAALGVPVIYGVGRRLFAARESAHLAALWFPLIPALVIFSATWSTIYPIFSLGALWLLHDGLERRRVRSLVLAGIVMGVALFLNYTFVPLVGLMGFYTLLYYGLIERRQTPPPPLWRPIWVGSWFGVGVFLPWAVYFLYSGDTPFTLLAASMDHHLEIDRPYLPWVIIHYWDWTFFNGFALMLAWYAGLVAWLRRRGQTPPVLALALLCTVAALALSGTARGESGRVWLPFTPFVLLAAAGFAALYPTDKPSRRTFALVLTALHALMLVVLALFVDPINTDLVRPTAPAVTESPARPINAVFESSDGSEFRLAGWNATLTPDGEIDLRLLWQGEQESVVPYWFGAFWIASDGTQGEPVLWQPGQSQGQANRFPTTCWTENLLIEDHIRLPLPNTPDQALAGEVWLSLAAFGDTAQPEGRLRVRLPDGTADVQVGLGPVSASIP